METKLIECKLIDVPKVEGSKRTFSKEFAVKLADSLKVDGQLNPIVVRTNPNAPGRYIMVAGRHRLYGMKNVNKEQFINATIAEGMDDAEAAIAADVENLWRNPLNKAQTAAALKRWHTHWLKNLPADAAPAAIAAAKAAVADHSDQSTLPAPMNAEAETPTPEPEKRGTAANETAFNKKVAAATGQSEMSVRRVKAIANAFTEDQLEVFTQMDVSQTDMLTIAKIKDASKRAEIVALIASSMTVEDAIKEIMKDAAPSRYMHKEHAGEEKAAAKVSKEVKAPELTDDEWFEQNCSEKAGMFGDYAKFKADALLFRSVSDLRHTFRTKGKGFLAATKKAGVTGAFYNLVNRFISISHPKDWLLCPQCKGQGADLSPTSDGTTHKCPKCFGGGYLLKTEEFL